MVEKWLDKKKKKGNVIRNIYKQLQYKAVI